MFNPGPSPGQKSKPLTRHEASHVLSKSDAAIHGTCDLRFWSRSPACSDAAGAPSVPPGRHRPRPARRRHGQRNPDDTCLVFNDDDQRGPGQACVCATDCTTGNCDQGVCCAGAACGAKRPDGAACTDGTQCTSGFCADGVCCNVACTGACLACNQPEMMGECAPVGAGVADPHMVVPQGFARAPAGKAASATARAAARSTPPTRSASWGAAIRRASSSRPAPATAKGPASAASRSRAARPSASGSECVRVCTSNDQCVAGKTCLNGSCGKFGPGQTCDQNTECDSNFCVDGVCCESACTGACQSCSNPATRGKCVPAAAGVADPACPVHGGQHLRHQRQVRRQGRLRQVRQQHHLPRGQPSFTRAGPSAFC